jgi:glutaredoxin
MIFLKYLMSDKFEFLIFGNENCKFCNTSKETLNNYKYSYTYVDLGLLYGDDWRQIFKSLEPILKGQRTIPIILVRCRSGSGSDEPDFIAPITPERLSSWTMLGSYNELLRYLDSVSELELDPDAPY